MTLAIVVLICTTLFLLYRWLEPQIWPRPLPGIPHNNVRAFGDGEAFAKSMQETGSTLAYQQMMFLKHGPISQILLPFGMSMISLEDPAATRELHVKHTPMSADRDQQFAAPALGGLLRTGQVAQPSGDVHKRHRRALAPILSKTYLARMVPRVANAAQELVELWKVKGRLCQEHPFEAKEDVARSITDASGSFLFGYNFGETRSSIDAARQRTEVQVNERGGVDVLTNKASELYESIDELLKSMGRALLTSNGFPRLFHAIDRWRPRRRHAQAYTYAFLCKQIENARFEYRSRGGSQEERGDSVVAMFAEKEGAEHGVKLGTDELVDELLTLMAAGAETTAYTLQWGIKMLAREPEVQVKLRAHLIKCMPSLDEHLPALDDLDDTRVPYLEACVYEIIRLSGSNSASLRELKSDIVLCGHHLPKGTRVLMSMSHNWAEQPPSEPFDEAEARHTRGCGYWRDPGRFMPERWIDSDGNFDSRAGPFTAFGGGTRGCWGRSIALIELRIYVAILSLSFFFERLPTPLDSNKAKSNISIAPEELYCRPVAWQDRARL